jgi:hypothetical protein
MGLLGWTSKSSPVLGLPGRGWTIVPEMRRLFDWLVETGIQK